VTQLTRSREEALHKALHIALDNRLLQRRRAGVSQKTPGCRSDDIAGNKDETLEQVGMRRPQMSVQGEAVAIRHVQVAQNQVVGVRGEALQRCGGVPNELISNSDSSPIYLLYAPLTIPLAYCHINSFQRASGLVRPS
jgi:hypothetical protein